MITVIGYNKEETGKTITAINLVVALALKNKDIYLIDADHECSVSRWHQHRETNKF